MSIHYHSNGLISRVFAWFLFLSFLAYNPFSLDGALASKTTAIALVLTLTLVAVFLKFLKEGGEFQMNRFQSLVFTILISFLIFRGISSLFTSNLADAYFFLARDSLFVILLLTLLLMYRNVDDMLRNMKGPFTFYLLMSLSMALIQLTIVLFSGGYNAPSSYEIKSFFAHRNMFAHILVLNLPLLIYYMRDKNGLRLVYNILLIISLFLIVVLYCRTAWMATIAAFSALVMWHFIFNKHVTKSYKKGNTWWILMLLIGLTAFMLFDVEEFTKQWHSLTHWHYGSIDKRLALWSASFQLIAEHPIMGSGLSSWKIEILRFISSDAISDGHNVFYQRPHNDWIWIWAESGVFALLSYAALFSALFYRMIRIDSALNKYALFGLIVYVVMSLLSFPLERMEHQIWLAVFVVIVLLLDKEEAECSMLKVKRYWLVVLIIVSLSIFVVGVMRLKGEYYTSKAFIKAGKGDYLSTISNIEKGKNSFFTIDGTSTPLAYHSGMAFLNLGKNNEAEIEFSEAYNINPYHILIVNNYASTLYRLGRLKKAEKLYKKALLLDPHFNDALVNLAIISIKKKDVFSAFDYLPMMDTAQINTEHKETVIAILRLKLNQMGSGSEDDVFLFHLHRIDIDSNWIFDLFLKSILENRSFEEQVRMDIEYLKKEEVAFE